MFATCVENNQIFVPTSENTWNYESSMERKTSLVTSVVRVTQPSNIYKFTRANIPVRNLIAVRNVEKHLLTQVLWKITRNSTNTTSRSHVRYVERLLRSRRTWKATWWYTTQTQTSKLEKIVHPKSHEFSFFGYWLIPFSILFDHQNPWRVWRWWGEFGACSSPYEGVWGGRGGGGGEGRDHHRAQQHLQQVGHWLDLQSIIIHVQFIRNVCINWAWQCKGRHQKMVLFWTLK